MTARAASSPITIVGDPTARWAKQLHAASQCLSLREMPKDRRGTCARRVTPYLPSCCRTSLCALQPRLVCGVTAECWASGAGPPSASDDFSHVETRRLPEARWQRRVVVRSSRLLRFWVKAPNTNSEIGTTRLARPRLNHLCQGLAITSWPCQVYSPSPLHLAAARASWRYLARPEHIQH